MKDTKDGYGWLSILLHWGTAGLILALLFVAVYAESLPREIGRPYRFLHVSLGLLFIPAYLLRLIWRVKSGHPETVYGGRVVTFLGNLTWRALLFVPMIMIATGPFLSWLHGRPLSFFGLFEFASPFAKNHELRMALGDVHAAAGYSILGFALLHILGVLKHVVIDRDNAFKRMFIPS